MYYIGRPSIVLTVKSILQILCVIGFTLGLANTFTASQLAIFLSILFVLGKPQGLMSQVGQSHDPGKRKGVPSKQYIGADFSLLESQTSYIGFEFPAKPSVCPR